ncbi:MAG: hypothetical protein ACRCZI_15295 [Cetobacterium sp.]
MDFFTADQLLALQQKVVRAATLCELFFDTTPERVWNGDTLLTAGGRSWKPLRGAGFIDGIPGLGQGTAESVTLRLSGTDESILALTLSESDLVSQRLMVLYMQLMGDDWQPIGQPLAVFYGYMQPPRVDRSVVNGEEGSEQSISIECLNAFYNRSRPPYGRYNDSDQQRRYDGDKFFSFVSSLVSKIVTYPDY